MSHPAKLAVLALQQIAKVLDRLTEEQLNELVEGRAVVEFRSQDAVVSSGRARASSTTGSRAQAPAKADIDVSAAVEAIKAMNTSAEVSSYLDTNGRQFTADVLKAIARALGPTVSATGTKAVLKNNIVTGTAGFRERSRAVFEEGWQR
jgi:hypothetical protein